MRRKSRWIGGIGWFVIGFGLAGCEGTIRTGPDQPGDVVLANAGEPASGGPVFPPGPPGGTVASAQPDRGDLHPAGLMDPDDSRDSEEQAQEDTGSLDRIAAGRLIVRFGQEAAEADRAGGAGRGEQLLGFVRDRLDQAGEASGDQRAGDDAALRALVPASEDALRNQGPRDLSAGEFTRLLGRIRETHVLTFAADRATTGNLKRELLQNRESLGIERVEYDRIMRTSFAPDDAYLMDGEDFRRGSWGNEYPDLYGVVNSQALQAWDLFPEVVGGAPPAGEGVLVAVVDTGLDRLHPDIQANAFINTGEVPGNGVDDDGNGYVDDVHGWDFVNGDNDPADGHGHGTHCAGTIAAAGNNGEGIVGIAYRAKVVGIKGLSDSGSGYLSGLAEAVVYAADLGADVISNSWGGSGRSEVLEDAFAYAHEVGSVPIAAAGNSNTDAHYYQPAGIRSVITVTAFNPAFHKASFSSHGKVDVAAPGGGYDGDVGENYLHCNILSLNANGGDNNLAKSYPFLVVGDDYLRIQGTSMACPHVAGLAALVLSYNRQVLGRDLAPEQVRQAIKLGASPLMDPMGDGTDWGEINEFAGAGHIDAVGALEASSAALVPVVRITSPDELSNHAGAGSIEIEGLVLAERVSQDDISVEVAPASKRFSSDSNQAPLEWIPVTGFSYIAATGQVSALAEVPDASARWLYIRLSVDTGSSVAYDEIMVVNDYLELFEILEPDFGQYGYKEDMLMGSQGVLPVTFGVPAIDYQALGLTIELGVAVIDRAANQSIEIDSIVNPSPGQWATVFDTVRFHDGIYDIRFDKKAKAGGETYSTSEMFRSNTGVHFHVNNATILEPEYLAVFTDHAPIRVTGTSMLPVTRLEAGAGLDPSAWVQLEVQSSGSGNDGLPIRFESLLHPRDLDLSGSNLVSIRLINTSAGAELENERIAVIIDERVTPGWPRRSAAHQGAFELVVGDVDGDDRDDVAVATWGVQYFWTMKEYYQEEFMETVSRAYLYDGHGVLDTGCLSRSEALLNRDMEGVLTQYVFKLGLAQLDGSPGLEMVAVASKQGAIFFSRKNEIVALTGQGSYPGGWTPVVDDQFGYEFPQRMGIVDADGNGLDELFLDKLRGDPRSPEGRTLTLLDSRGGILAERDANDFFPNVGNIYVGDTLASGDLLQNDSGNVAEVFVNLNSDTEDGRIPHPVLLDAISLEPVVEMTIDPDLRVYTNPIAGNLDDDGEPELLYSLRNEAQSFGETTRWIFASNPDGSPVAGWPYAPQSAGGEDWKLEAFTLVDVDADGRVEVLALEEWLESGSYPYRYHHRLNLLDADGTQVPGWPIQLPDEFNYYLDRILVADLDTDGEAEFMVPGTFSNGNDVLFRDGLSDYGFNVGRWRPYPVLLFETDGSIVDVLYVSGSPRLALGDIDGDGAAELVAAYSYADLTFTGTRGPGIYLEVVAFDLGAGGTAERIDWSQQLGDARRSNLYTSSRPGPEVASMQPPGGYVTTTVRIRGSGFGSNPAGSGVTFGGVAATEILDWVDGEIQVKVPAGAESGAVVVTTDAGSAEAGDFQVWQAVGQLFLSDLDRDGDVDGSDLAILANNWGQSPPENPRADLNGDDSVNILDWRLFGEDYGSIAWLITDVNQDGIVTVLDKVTIRDCFDQDVSTCPDADIDRDGVVDDDDQTIVSVDFGRTSGDVERFLLYTDLDRNGTVDELDLRVVEEGSLPWADVNRDGVVDWMDEQLVSRDIDTGSNP